jgi:hypothetical protein
MQSPESRWRGVMANETAGWSVSVMAVVTVGLLGGCQRQSGP